MFKKTREKIFQQTITPFYNAKLINSAKPLQETSLNLETPSSFFN